MLQMSLEILQSFKLLFVFIILPKSKHQKVSFLNIVKGRKMNTFTKFTPRSLCSIIKFIFVDRCEMRNYEQIEKLQKHYLTILQCLLKVNHKEDRLILPKIIGILTELRNITDVFYKASTENGGHLPLIKDSAPLLMEMVTSVRQ